MRRLIYLPIWLIVLAVYIGFSFFEMVWLTVKKTKITQKIIYSGFIQICKEKIVHRPKISKNL